jgi:hypothetical protein
LQATAAASLACALLAGSEFIGATLAARDVTLQEHWDRLRDQAELKRLQDADNMTPVAYTSGGVRLVQVPELLVDYPRAPADELAQKVAMHEQKARSWGWMGSLALFLTGSTTSAASATRHRNRLEAERARADLDRAASAPPPPRYFARGYRSLFVYETPPDELAQAGSDTASRILGSLGLATTNRLPSREVRMPVAALSPVPAAGEISHEEIAATTRSFEPGVYYSSEYGTEMGALDGMFNNPQLTFAERMVHRVRTALTARRERIRAQQEVAAASYNPYDVYHNTIEPIIFDAPAPL